MFRLLLANPHNQLAAVPIVTMAQAVGQNLLIKLFVRFVYLFLSSRRGQSQQRAKRPGEGVTVHLQCPVCSVQCAAAGRERKTGEGKLR